jgi:hypothetical protein
MEDKTSTYSSTQKVNPLPKVAKDSTFFSNTAENITPFLPQQDLKKSIPEIKQNNLQLESSISPIKTTQPTLIPLQSIKQSELTAPYKQDKENNILTTNVNTENLIKTEGISKTNFNIAELANKNREIRTLDEKIKQFPLMQTAKKTPTMNVVNNYNNGGGQKGMAAPRSDALAGIKNTMRAYPAWRTEMG